VRDHALTLDVDHPLWQIVLSIMVLGLMVQRAAVGITYFLSAHEPWLVVAYGLQGLGGVLVWASLLWARGMLYAAIGVLGATVAATAGLEGFVLDRVPRSTAIFQIVAIIAASTACMLVAGRVLKR
jgi:hypothetical protein